MWALTEPNGSKHCRGPDLKKVPKICQLPQDLNSDIDYLLTYAELRPQVPVKPKKNHSFITLIV